MNNNIYIFFHKYRNIENCSHLNIKFIYPDSHLETCNFSNTNIICYYYGSCKTIEVKFENSYIYLAENEFRDVRKCSKNEINYAKEEMEKV